jgi:hypothetical protein
MSENGVILDDSDSSPYLRIQFQLFCKVVTGVIELMPRVFGKGRSCMSHAWLPTNLVDTVGLWIPAYSFYTLDTQLIVSFTIHLDSL